MKEVTIDITITATRRHEILRRTLESFKKNLFKEHPIRIFINVDPVGPDESAFDCVNVALEVFPHMFIDYKSPKEPNLSEAFKWTWEASRSERWNVPPSEFVFHLEDDWELLREINLKDMINMLNKYKSLALLRLPQFKSTATDMKNWNLFFPYNPITKYFECPESLIMTAGFCGHPSLIKGEFVRSIAPNIDTTKNPEKQFHHGPPEIMNEVIKWKYGVYSQPNMPPAIADIGRKWSVETGWQKKGPKAWFLQWEKKGE